VRCRTGGLDGGAPGSGAFRERRGLAEAGPPRGVAFVFEPINLLPDSVAFPAQAIAVAFDALEPLDLAPLAFDLRLLPLELLQQVLA
jgi:hypothetical protein